MPEYRWFRMYSEFATDPAVQCMAFEDQRHYVVSLCLKCAGVLDKDYPTDQQRQQVLRRAFGLDSEAIGEAKRRLIEAGLIDNDWQPLAWDRRQFQSDISTDRVRKFREKQKKTGNKGKRRRNVSETVPSASVSVFEKEGGSKGGELVCDDIPALNLDAWHLWQQHRAKRKLPRYKTDLKARELATLPHGEQMACVEHSIGNEYAGLFPDKFRGGSKATDSYHDEIRRAVANADD